MEKEMIEVYCGSGRGKTALAVGQSLRASMQGKSVIIIQFLKGKEERSLEYLEKISGQDIKIFRFEKKNSCYEDLNEEQKEEEKLNILNSLNFARKVIVTQECDFLVLDEILGLLDSRITTVEAVEDILKLKHESMHIILTGRCLPSELKPYVDSVTTLTTEELN